MKILQVSCTYFPEIIGGTETYVRHLSKSLLNRGHRVSVSYFDAFRDRSGPQVKIRKYTFDDIAVFAISRNTSGAKTQDIYFQEQEKSRPFFAKVLDEVEPDIVHFHHLSPTDIVWAMELSREKRIPVVLTYHTPMMTCGQGYMLYCGKKPCVGKMEFKRCLVCMQVGFSVPYLLAWIWASLPPFLAAKIGEWASALSWKSPFMTWLELPWLSRKRLERLQYAFSLVDCFVAVSDWVRGVLLANGVKEERIILSRQGIEKNPGNIARIKDGVVRYAFVGRIAPCKGLDVLLKAVKSLDAGIKNIEVEIYGTPYFDCEKRYLIKLQDRYSKEKRIKWMGFLKPEDKFEALSRIDALVIPSVWLETGPLVLLEAWAAGVPVIGSNLGGIAELVTNGGGGLLFSPGNYKELSDIFQRLSRDPSELERLSKTIPVPKTMDEVAQEMGELYQDIHKRRISGR